MKEWLCLTCQMQRALKATESVQPPQMKPQASPSKVSTPASSLKDGTTNQNKDIIATQEAGGTDKIQGSLPKDAPQKKKDISKTSSTASPAVKDATAAVTDPVKEEKSALCPAENAPTSSAPQSKETGPDVSDLKKPMLATPVTIDVQTLDQKTNLPSFDPTKVKLEDNKEKADKIQKSADQLITDEVQHQQALKEESHPVEKSSTESGPPPPLPEGHESGSFLSFGGPKSQRVAPRTTEVVTGKVLGSLFSSASTLITSAVQEDTRTTPSARKMSAPQVSDRTSEISSKSSPQLSRRRNSLMEGRANQMQRTHLEKTPDQALSSGQGKVDKDPLGLAKPEASQVAPKVGQSTCPLCKVDLNMDSKNIPNYNTCTDCKTNVCNKCGFSPMPNATEVIKRQTYMYMYLYRAVKSKI